MGSSAVFLSSAASTSAYSANFLGDEADGVLSNDPATEIPAMLPLYAVHLRDLGPCDRVQVNCVVFDHTRLLPAEFLLRLGLARHDNVPHLTRLMRCRGMRGCEVER
ncbi:MAG: hypothetical protein QOH31_4629 [Verrucomicrobiota bacterium]|jgi:hypothetical protein